MTSPHGPKTGRPSALCSLPAVRTSPERKDVNQRPRLRLIRTKLRDPSIAQRRVPVTWKFSPQLSLMAFWSI